MKNQLNMHISQYCDWPAFVNIVPVHPSGVYYIMHDSHDLYDDNNKTITFMGERWETVGMLKILLVMKISNGTPIEYVY